MSTVALPRNTTRQTEATLFGEKARVLHRVCGAVIVVFVLVHVLVQAILHVPAFGSVKSGTPWLAAATQQHWIHAILWFCIIFHTLHGLRLLALDLGARLDARRSFFVIVAVSSAFAVREVLRYAGI